MSATAFSRFSISLRDSACWRVIDSLCSCSNCSSAGTQQLGQALARAVTLVRQLTLQRDHAPAQCGEGGEAADRDAEDDE